MRKLASVVTVSSIMKMYQKDRIVCASFEELGYEAIVQNTVKVGDLLAFIQEGSILPVKEEWEFLRKRCFNESVNGFIIKPMKMGKKELPDGSEGDAVKSWGLVVPLEDIEELKGRKVKAGEDLTELLGILKYEPAEDASPKSGESNKAYPKWVKFCLSHFLTRWIGRIWQKKHQNSSGGFPSDLISKSDETTIQNMKSALEKFKDEKVYISSKIEGQSFTVVPVFKGKKFKTAYVCSRNNAYKLEDRSVFWNCMRNFNIIEKMKKIYKDTGKAYILQGEQVGPGIQENIYDFNTHKWFVFTVKDFFTGKQLPLDEAIKVTADFGLDFVPVIKENVLLKDVMPTIKDAVDFAERAAWKFNSGTLELNYTSLPEEKIWEDYLQHEGVVVRSMNYDKDNNIGISFKVKNSDYQLKSLSEIHKLAISMKRR